MLPQVHTRAQSLLTTDRPPWEVCSVPPGSARVSWAWANKRPTLRHPKRREGALEPKGTLQTLREHQPHYRGHKDVSNHLHRVPLSHAAGQRDLEQAVALQHLLDPEEDCPQLPLAQHLGLHLPQRLLILLRQRPTSMAQAFLRFNKEHREAHPYNYMCVQINRMTLDVNA